MLDAKEMLLIRSLVSEVEHMTHQIERSEIDVEDAGKIVLALENAKEKLQEVYLDQIQMERELKMACSQEGMN